VRKVQESLRKKQRFTFIWTTPWKWHGEVSLDRDAGLYYYLAHWLPVRGLLEPLSLLLVARVYPLPGPSSRTDISICHRQIFRLTMSTSQARVAFSLKVTVDLSPEGIRRATYEVTIYENDAIQDVTIEAKSTNRQIVDGSLYLRQQRNIFRKIGRFLSFI
jgi:hypothetical protein